MYRSIATLVKLLIASLIAGAVLTRLNLSAEDILSEVGLTPENILQIMRDGFNWAAPNVVLGSMVILPVWLVVFLFRPPRS